MTCTKCHHVHHGEPVCAFQISPGRYCKCRGAAAPRLTAGDIVGMIRRRYEARAGWTVFEEAANGTGYHAARYCDALVLQTWPSRGLTAHGFEIKVDRRDLMRELREPKKADTFQRWCDRWWIVVPDVDLFDGLALPETWGVMIVKKGKLAVHREAPELKPEPWGKPFVAALARSLTDGLVPKRDLDEARAQSEETIRARIEEALTRDRERRGGADAQLEALRKQVAEFERAAGLELHGGWNIPLGKRLGGIVAMLRWLVDDEGRLHAFERTLTDAARVVDQIREVHDAIRAAASAPPESPT